MKNQFLLRYLDKNRTNDFFAHETFDTHDELHTRIESLGKIVLSADGKRLHTEFEIFELKSIAKIELQSSPPVVDIKETK